MYYLDELINYIFLLWEYLSRHPVYSAVVAAAIVGIPSFIYRAFSFNTERKYRYLVGEYHAYHLLRDGRVIEWKFIIRLRRTGSLKIRVNEVNSAAYQYVGTIHAHEGFLYAAMEGVTHDTKAFLVLRLPFNRGKELVSAVGVLAGVTQSREPASVMMVLHRTPLSNDEVKDYFDNQNGALICTKLPPSVEKTKAYPDIPSE